MSSEAQSQSRQQEEKRPFVQRKTVFDAKGNAKEVYDIMDPLGHRLNNSVTSPWVVGFSQKYPGLFNNKALMFGHHREKDRELMYANSEAYTALCDLASRVPSASRIADSWFAGRIEAMAEIGMGMGGQAINSENTKTTKTITREEKPSRFSLRR
jgi:hypothetical protein